MKKVATGLLVGAGFASAMLAFGYTLIKWEDHSNVRKPYSPQSGLAIENHHEEKAGSGHFFVGTLHNGGTANWSYVSIEVELYDASDRFIDRCSSSENVTIGAGRSRNFKVTCEGPTRVDYDHYRIAIRDAYAADAGPPD